MSGKRFSIRERLPGGLYFKTLLGQTLAEFVLN
jgi:hypothetical protein